MNELNTNEKRRKNVFRVLTTPIMEYFKRNAGILMGLIALIIVVSINTPVFLSTKNILNILRQISNNLYLAAAITMILISGGIDLSAGAVISLSSVLVSTFMVNVGLSVPVAILGTLTVGFLVGLINGVIIYKTDLPPFIVTLSTQYICQGFAYIITGAQPVRLTDQNFIRIGTGFILGIPLPLYYLIIILGFSWYILNQTRLGRHIYAVGGNTKAAEFSGVSIRKVRLFVYIFSGVMAAVAGIVLSARMYSGQPTAGGNSAMDAIASVVLGGVSMGGGQGTIGGMVIGALIIGVLGNGLNLAGIDSYWQMAAKGVIIIVAVYVDYMKKAGGRGIKLRKAREVK